MGLIIKLSDIFYICLKCLKMVRRKLFDKLVKYLFKKEFSIITGARQTGKSTLLRQLGDYCQENEIPYVFFNLEDKSILAELSNNPRNVLKYLPSTNKRIVVMVDEVQYLEDPSNFMKLIYDEYADKIKIVATGSSAFYMDDRFNDSLAGRKRIFQLFTCSFAEYLEIGGKPEIKKEVDRLIEKKDTKSTMLDLIRIAWEDYILYGGYPAVITEQDKEEKIFRLRELRDSFIKRDIQESGVVNETAFYFLFRILAAQTGNLVNVNELATTLRIQNTTVTNYLNIMQKCFHITLVRPFYRNLRKELIKMPKVFLLDTGMRNCLLDNFQSTTVRPDRGELWENAVYRILVEKYGFDSIFYWRTTAGNEIDFVLPGIAAPSAIEAKFDKIQIKPKKYKNFTETYPEIALQYFWMVPFDENFFRRLYP